MLREDLEKVVEGRKETTRRTRAASAASSGAGRRSALRACGELQAYSVFRSGRVTSQSFCGPSEQS